MSVRRFLLCAAILLLQVPPCAVGEGSGDAALRGELRSVEARLQEKRSELARLRHRWVVAKGRVPTEKEMKEFEEKLAKGKADPLDNPYYNKNPLGTPAPARAAYFRKLEEVRQDEERLRRLREELGAGER